MSKTIRYYINRIARNVVNLLVFIFSKKNGLVKVNDELTVIFDHNLGGGTTLYRKNFLRNICGSYLLITNFSISFKDLGYIVSNDIQKELITYKNLLKLLENVKINTIYINSLVSYVEIEKIFSLILKAHEKRNSDVIILFHDYYPICPNYVLLCEKRYCNCVCNKKRIKIPLTARKVSLIWWTEQWNQIYQIAKELRTFSLASKSIIVTKNPDVANKVTVIPHSLEYLESIKPIEFNAYENKQMKVGVLGQIFSEEKGLNIVKELSKSIEVNIIGSIWTHNRNIINYGSYSLDDLREKIIDSGVNVILFPSIWPETFSYVVSEIIKLNIPVVCFPLGAQEEKVRNYSKGVVCLSYNIKEILNSLDRAYNLLFK